ncbi:zinc finger BED domain-containing protein DAYSLEEPER-like [Alosa alosa]|uniref:zinc finger BED domain-containing protein DAYSLEEPER-like n=1 Tax=Alosa alosa TaxID=278164 RepID=UPI0020153553|nr:zinc finger BED domain-containing protein DAYSLEEPER-like [Alosa alosa]
MSKRKVSVVFDHFYIPDNKELVCKARCKYCPLEMSFNRKATSNLLNHMKRKHASIPLGPSSSSDQWPGTEPTCSQPQSPNKWNSNDPSQILGNQALVNLIAGEQLPVSIVQSPFFLSFIQEIQPCYNVPDGEYFANTLLDQQTRFLQDKLKTLANTAQSVCLTVDVWNAMEFTYMTITGHLVINYTLKSVLLSCKRTCGQQLRVSTTKEIDNVLTQYNVSRETIILLSESPAQGVINLPGFQQTERDGNITRGILKMEDDEDSAHETEDGELTPGSMTAPLNIQPGPSFAQALQLVVRDSLPASSQATTNALAKVYSKAAQGHNRNIQQASDWTSQLKEVRHSLGQSGDRQTQHANVNSFIVSPFERTLLEDFLHTLQPFEEITDRLRRERVVPASLVIPSIQGIRKHLRSPTEQNHKLVVALEVALEKWLTPFERRWCYRRATALDPRLKLRWCEGDWALQMRQDLLGLTGGAERNALSADDTAASLQTQAKKRSLFPFFEDEPQDSQPDTQDEVETYLLEPCIPYHHDPLVYWRGNQHRFPQLAQLALRHQAIPALPVPAMYSNNARISDEEFEKLMFIKLNSALL